MPYPVAISFLGIAKETTPGTAVAATDYIPVTSFEPHDEQVLLEDTGQRGAMVDVYDHIAGPNWATYGFAGNAHPDTIGYPLANILGDVVTSGSAPTSHTMAVKNSGDAQPVTHTLTDFNGINARQFAGARFSEVAFDFGADGLLTYNAAATTFASATAATPTASWGTIPPVANWQLAVTIGGGAVTTVEGGSVSLKRPISVLNTADGTQAPYKLFAGPLSVEGKLMFVMEADTELTRYLTNTKPILVLDLSNGAGASLVEVKFTMSKSAYTVANVVRSKDWVELEVDFKADANSTDVGASGGFSPVKVLLKNAKASGTFA